MIIVIVGKRELIKPIKVYKNTEGRKPPRFGTKEGQAMLAPGLSDDLKSASINMPNVAPKSKHP